MPGGKVVLVMTRWHETDLAGYLLEQRDTAPMADKWEVVRIPALNTTESLETLEPARKKLIKQGYLSLDFTKLKLGESFCCLLYTSPSPRDRQKSRMPSSA